MLRRNAAHRLVRHGRFRWPSRRRGTRSESVDDGWNRPYPSSQPVQPVNTPTPGLAVEPGPRSNGPGPTRATEVERPPGSRRHGTWRPPPSTNRVTGSYVRGDPTSDLVEWSRSHRLLFVRALQHRDTAQESDESCGRVDDRAATTSIANASSVLLRSECAEGPWARRAVTAEDSVMNGMVIFVGTVVIAVAAIVIGRRRQQSHK